MAESQLFLVVLCALTLCCQSNKPGLDLEAKIVAMKKRAESQSELIRHQQVVIDTLEKKLSDLEAASVTAEADFVAFSAYITDGDKYIDPDGYIPFEGVESNYGNHYDPKESEFICPTTGLYFFTFTLYSAELGQDLTVEDEEDYFISSGTLIVGQRTNVEIFNKNKIESGYIAMQGSNSVIVKCERDQSVWVASQYTSNRCYGADKARRSTFSGMRVLNLEEKEQAKGEKPCDR